MRAIALLISLFFFVEKAFAQTDILKNRAELSLPITDKKLVIAHCMTNIIRYKDHPFEDGCNPDYYPVKDNATAAIGGMTQVKVWNDSLLKNASLDDAVEFEMRAAKESGIDGFQFYYTLNDHGSDEIIKAYFKVAKLKKIDFKMTLCISHPSGSSEDEKISRFAQRINRIFDAVGHDDDHWLRTPDGRLIVYMWYGEQLADTRSDSKTSPAYNAAYAFEKLGKAVREKFACVWSINENVPQDVLNDYLDYFPAVWMWTLPYRKNYAGQFVATTCKMRKRTFTGSAFNDFYTSKVLQPGTWNILSAKKAVDAGFSKIERKAIVTDLSFNFRKMMEFNIEQDVPIVNIITWNDYPEGHHLAPEFVHNDGFTQLLKYYKTKWQKLPVSTEEKAIVFYKKYPAEKRPDPFDIKLIYVEKGAVKPSAEDGIELVTILNEPAFVKINDDTATLPSGFYVKRFAGKAGVVSVSLSRNGKSFIDFFAKEPITDNPVRTDRLTYTYSNETEEYYKKMAEAIPSTNVLVNNN